MLLLPCFVIVEASGRRPDILKISAASRKSADPRRRPAPTYVARQRVWLLT